MLFIRLRRLLSYCEATGTLYMSCDVFFKSAINDDKILAACLSLCSDPTLRGDMQDLKTESLRLKRNLVLLTEDRALNIKAVAKNVPVRTVPSFARWAHLV